MRHFFPPDAGHDHAVCFEPEVRSGRRPDLLVSKGQENIYLEVKIVGAAERERFIAKITEKVSYACFPKLSDDLSCEIELSEGLQGLWQSRNLELNDRLVAAVTSQVTEAVRTLVASGVVPAQTDIPEIATISISPKTAVPYSSIRGATLSAGEEIVRVIRNALFDAAEQLPDNVPGVVVVGMRFLPEVSFARLILDSFFAASERFAHLSAVVLTINYVSDGQHQRWGMILENPKAQSSFAKLSIHNTIADWLHAERRW